MPTYRAYLINEDNRVAAYTPIDADTDAEALTAARPLADGCDVEVWCLDRKIGRPVRQAPMRSTKRWKTLAWEASFFRDVSSRPRRARLDPALKGRACGAQEGQSRGTDLLWGSASSPS
jgi:hypothetical protein